MNIAIVGAGIVGITCAYEFARDGHTVDVYEQASAAAVASSFANAGILAPSLTPHLSHPTWPHKRRLLSVGASSQISLGHHTQLKDLGWLRKWKSGTRSDDFLARVTSTMHLSQFSQQHLEAVAAETKIDFEQTDGQLLLIRSAAQLDSLAGKLALLKEQGIAMKQLTPEQVAAVEPALKLPSPLHCAIQFPGDSVGNCRQFALAAKKELQHMGVNFTFNARVSSIEMKPGPCLHFEEGSTPRSYDQVILCTGTGAQYLLDALQIRLPMATIASYSLTARIREGLNAPKSAIFDNGNLTSTVRLGNRIRVSCGAELGSAGDKHNNKAVQHLYHMLQQSFPGAADFSSGVQVWKGSFGVMCDGLPVIGQSAAPGVWLNLGHGPNGWGMACGAARCLADAVSNRPPPVSLEPFSPLRF